MSDEPLDAVRAYLARIHPGLTPEGRERRLQALLHRPHTEVARYVQQPDAQPSERALTAFWQDPTPDRAQEYITSLLPVLRTMRKAEGKAYRGAPVTPNEIAEPAQIGPYTLDAVLGHGGDGAVFRAKRTDADEYVALKLHARGDAIVPYAIGPRWPHQLVQTYETGTWGIFTWAARELADETLSDFVQRKGPLSKCITRDVFRTACEGVAALHERHIYGWSAHAKNVYRVGDQWQIGDFGRAWCFVPVDDPRLEARRQDLYDVLGSRDDEARQVADWLWARHHFGHWTDTGMLPYDQECEHRLRLDDCAMLGGLLVWMLTGKRWGWFFRALNARPYCSAKYPLTDDRAHDAHLSAIVNRCWRGDAGGAPLLANGGRGEQSVYDDPLELLAAVELAGLRQTDAGSAFDVLGGTVPGKAGLIAGDGDGKTHPDRQVVSG